MTYKLYPHTGTLVYVAGTVTYDTAGYKTQGTLATICVHCDIQHNVRGYTIGRDGDVISYSYKVFCPMLNTAFTDTRGLRFGFDGSSYQVLDITNYTKHTEIII